MKKPLKILLFDIDGTLLHTGGAGRIAIERVFLEEFGIQQAWGKTQPDGKTDPLIFEEIATRTLKRSLTLDEYERLNHRYIAYFRSEIQRSERYRVMEGARELLAALQHRPEYLMGIQTGNVEEAAWLKLEKGGLNTYFSFGGFGSDALDRRDLVAKAVERALQISKQPVPPYQIFVIGDAPQDILAGKALGLRTIGICTGRAKKEDLLSYKPDFCLPDLVDQQTFFKCLESGI